MRLIRSLFNPDKGLSFLFIIFTDRVAMRARMAMRARYVAWSLILIGALALFLAIAVVSHDPREQTVVLERFAEQLERAQRINPDTAQYVIGLIASFRQKPPLDKNLQQRQIAAINRIEATLFDHTGALRQKGTTQYRRNLNTQQVSGGM